MDIPLDGQVWTAMPSYNPAEGEMFHIRLLVVKKNSFSNFDEAVGPSLNFVTFCCWPISSRPGDGKLIFAHSGVFLQMKEQMEEDDRAVSSEAAPAIFSMHYIPPYDDVAEATGSSQWSSRQVEAKSSKPSCYKSSVSSLSGVNFRVHKMEPWFWDICKVYWWFSQMAWSNKVAILNAVPSQLSHVSHVISWSVIIVAQML